MLNKIRWQVLAQLQNFKNNFVFMPFNKTKHYQKIFYFILFYVYTFKLSQVRKISVFPEKISQDFMYN